MMELELITKVYPITKNCQLLYERGEHALLGISPFNSYFSEKNIAILSNWAMKNFKSFNFFIPDEPYVYTLMALGYDKVKAIKKSKRQANYLKNKCLRALTGLDLSTNEAEALILDFRYLNKNKNYLSALKFYEDKYANDSEFRINCIETSKQVVETRTYLSYDRLEIAVKYLLAELPLFFNSVSILGKKEGVFCYRYCPLLIQTVFEKKNGMVLNNQGYLIIDIESN
ncbi:MAG: tRNA-dependent cyclodipeptide synthase [Moorea sp. SIOASIH]|uniref:tRNA-dependent cyclodipeptide synthase n=1 Tax=Moorena sp. SIOASIH TaxID=2607817 RepID=UPI0013B94FBD|nr:tRNA-dependent cyclodipeptide synthase [Moorena sp. SIOASIH]NEO35291.1 tRNA-dependent cyclodipeptide synthase [Moorena sp. SIOASIH]